MENQKTNKCKLVTIILAVLLSINMVVTCVLLGIQIKNKINVSKEKTKYTLYIGTNDKDTYKPVYDFDVCLTKVTEICTKYTDGCTIYEANGYWKDEKNEITNERTIACILEDIQKETVYKICDEVIVTLNQNSILVETSNVITTFYSTSNNK